MRRAAALLLATLAASCGGGEPDEVRVFAASSLTEVMQTIAADFEKETGVKVKLNLASSSTLARQIVEGAPCDVFLSADSEWADHVEKAGLVEPGTRRDLLTNDLTVVYPPGKYVLDTSVKELDVDPAADKRRRMRFHLTHESVRRIAMGDPSHVPAGRYSKEALEKLGIWQEVKGKIVACESDRAALALVERGEVDAGIVYVTDAGFSKGSRSVHRAFDRFFDTVEYDRFGGAGTIYLVRRVIPNPANPIRYPAMRIREAAAKAPRFDMYLDSLAARKVFEAAGFGIARKVD